MTPEKLRFVLAQVLRLHITEFFNETIKSGEESVAFAGWVQALGAFFPTEDLQLLFLKTGIVQFRNSGMQLFGSTQNAYDFVCWIR